MSLFTRVTVHIKSIALVPPINKSTRQYFLTLIYSVHTEHFIGAIFVTDSLHDNIHIYHSSNTDIYQYTNSEIIILDKREVYIIHLTLIYILPKNISN